MPCGFSSIHTIQILSSTTSICTIEILFSTRQPDRSLLEAQLLNPSNLMVAHENFLGIFKLITILIASGFSTLKKKNFFKPKWRFIVRKQMTQRFVALKTSSGVGRVPGPTTRPVVKFAEVVEPRSLAIPPGVSLLLFPSAKNWRPPVLILAKAITIKEKTLQYCDFPI